MNEKIFERVEKKYLITTDDEKYLLTLINRNMKKDNYYHSEVENIYFDNDNYDLIIQSNDRPLFKEKFRARSYAGYDKVFLEIKTKILGLAYRNEVLDDDDVDSSINTGYKRRILITHQDYEEFISGRQTALSLARKEMETTADLQIASEIDYIMNHFNLKPRVLVYYTRESYVGDSGLRITFDKDLKYRDYDLSFEKKSSDQYYFKKEPKIIMEIKAHGYMPLWLVKALSARHIYPQQFSKIGRIYEKIHQT